ncbi:hypothetical protein I9453_00155 [Campylobacter coli]|nr:hypothetical protein [Campylobacter coli]
MNYESKFEFIFLIDNKEITKSIPKNTLMDMLNILVKEARTKISKYLLFSNDWSNK